jgi:hypothetical protein
MEASGWVKFSDDCGLISGCCGNKNSKPPFSTNLRPISIQHSIRCPREQYCHGKYRYSQNEHILIKLVIRKVCKISVLALLWTEHQCCHYKHSKPSFSTNIRPIYIQHSIRCTRDHCSHFEYRYSQNEHILIKLVIKKCKISVLVDCCMTSIPNHLSPPI